MSVCASSLCEISGPYAREFGHIPKNCNERTQNQAPLRFHIINGYLYENETIYDT